MLVTCLLAAGAMGLWHTVEFFEKEKAVGEEYYQAWIPVSWQIEIKRSNINLPELSILLMQIVFTFDVQIKN